MRTTLLILAVLCSLGGAIAADAAQPVPYAFVWKNVSPAAAPVTCAPLEVQILNNGAVIDQRSSYAPLLSGKSLPMNFSVPVCGSIQLKALCSGNGRTNNNVQTIGCTGGSIEISSPDGMTFYR